MKKYILVNTRRSLAILLIVLFAVSFTAAVSAAVSTTEYNTSVSTAENNTSVSTAENNTSVSTAENNTSVNEAENNDKSVNEAENNDKSVNVADNNNTGVNEAENSDKSVNAADNNNTGVDAADNNNTGVSTGLSDADKNSILNAHNKYRAEVGVGPLVWDDQLAASAQKWADHLNAINTLEHSGSGENLIEGNFDGSWTKAIDFLATEKSCFKNGIFPDIYNGNCDNNPDCNKDWTCAGHYSQMIWSGTQKVGAGKSGDFWVLQYSPAGNVMGQKAF